MVFLCGGGIGITPIMGVLKDIYEFGLLNEKALSHSITTVYAVWVMPVIDDYASFASEFEVLQDIAKQPGMPALVLGIYITKSKGSLPPPFIAGRPKIGEIFGTMVTSHPGKAGMVLACGPDQLVAELWDHSIKFTMAGTRIDFHHEVFNF